MIRVILCIEEWSAVRTSLLLYLFLVTSQTLTTNAVSV